MLIPPTHKKQRCIACLDNGSFCRVQDLWPRLMLVINKPGYPAFFNYGYKRYIAADVSQRAVACDNGSFCRVQDLWPRLILVINKPGYPAFFNYGYKRYITADVSQRAVACVIDIYHRADSRLEPSQWETSLHINAVSRWLGANLESAW